MKVEWTIQLMSIAPSSSHTSSTGAAHQDTAYPADPHFRCTLSIEPSQGRLVCNGHPGQLQVFHASTLCFDHAIEVVPYSRVSRPERHSVIYAPTVSLFSFASVARPGGDPTALDHYLGTVDMQRGEELGVQDSLKVWQLCAATGRYAAVAQMDRPHGAVRVASLAMQSSAVGCLTAAYDGSIKLWAATLSSVANTAAATPSSGAQQQWVNLYAFKYRDCPANCLAFSPDASLLALAHENTVSLWEPAS